MEVVRAAHGQWNVLGINTVLMQYLLHRKFPSKTTNNIAMSIGKVDKDTL